MPHHAISTSAAPTPIGAYSQAIKAGHILATAGQVGVDPVTGRTPDGIGAQTRLALENLRAVLSAAGIDLNEVVKTTCFLSDIEDFAGFDNEYRAFFGDHRPARSTVGVTLPEGLLVEVEAWAVTAR